MTRSSRDAIGILLLSMVLAGCGSNNELTKRFMGRWGPDPALPSADAMAAMQNQAQVLSYIIQTAPIAIKDTSSMTPEEWFGVTKWGFNIGRQDCEVYLDNLFRMAREKARNDNILAAMSTAAALIVAGTTHAQKPLSIIAAAFGLSIAANDAIFQSFLFSQAPGLVAKKVKDLQDAYRASLETDHSEIKTGADAYNAIQNYYHICLPHAIEGVLLQTVADSNPTPTNTTPQTRASKKKKNGGTSAKPLNNPPTLE